MVRCWGRSLVGFQLKKNYLLNTINTSGKPKVTHHHLVPTSEEYIFCLEVSMDDGMVMEIAESRSNLQEYISGPYLRIFS